MEVFSASLALCGGNPLLNDGFPSQRPVTRSFDGFFLSAPEQTAEQTIEKPLCSLWRHCKNNLHQHPLCTVTHERHSVSHHWRLGWLSSGLFGLTTKNVLHHWLYVVPPASVSVGFPSQRASDAESVSRSWRSHDYHHLQKFFCMTGVIWLLQQKKGIFHEEP